VDSFYVIEGELEFTIGHETVRAGPGTSVLGPPGVVHAFTNASRGRVRFLNIHSPEGFVEYTRARARSDHVDSAQFDVHYVE
jgi:mannose-6-phosphate isomerase-like protein (cupin superfamily)